MNNTPPHAQAGVSSPPVRTMLLAVLAPFGVIGLMASPLLIDAVRHFAGV